MDPILAQTVQLLSGSMSQQIDTAIARQQIASDRAVAEFVADIANTTATSPPAPPGQGTIVDIKA